MEWDMEWDMEWEREGYGMGEGRIWNRSGDDMGGRGIGEEI
jgi:hypothetical protein